MQRSLTIEGSVSTIKRNAAEVSSKGSKSRNLKVAEEKSERTDHHRIAGLVLEPVLARLGFETDTEIDVSLQKQMIDLICVRREMMVEVTLPPIYWQVFGKLNEHNLISFKSYSESFNAQALEEFYGHLTNYCKAKKVRRVEVNLYIITNHYPKALLEPLHTKGLLEEVKAGEVYDLTMSTLKPVRFIVCQESDNLVLALFSTDFGRIQQAYQ